MAEEGKLLTIEKDYTEECAEKIPVAKGLAASGNLTGAIESLSLLERQTRTGQDVHSSAKVLVALVEMCYDAQQYAILNEQLIFLSKRRGAQKMAITKMVQKAVEFVNAMEDLDTKVSLIECLRTVTAGKIFVEVERARLTRTLASIHEAADKIKDAAEVLLQLQVETFGSMDIREKTEFIVEQMRMCLAIKDFTRAQILSRKISPKTFAKEDNHDLKLRYLTMMIELVLYDAEYLSACKHFRNVFDTPAVLADEAQWKDALTSATYYLLLSPFDNEQSDLTHRILDEKKLAQLPECVSLIKAFVQLELLHWEQIESEFGAVLRASSVFSADTELGQTRWVDLRKRVIEHNIRVIAQYYTQITSKRLASLLNLPENETEEFLSNLVVKKTVMARIDRPAGVVNFVKTRTPEETLNEWSHSVGKLMGLVDKTTHLIAKEKMVHAAGVVEAK